MQLRRRGMRTAIQRERAWLLAARGLMASALASAIIVAFAAGCSDDADPVTPTVTPIDADNPDRQVLIDFYNATGGRGWEQRANWDSPGAIGTWYGVDTNADGFVTELVLDDNNLTGTLPARLGDLAHLERLVLNGNSIQGRIPPELGKLTRLTMLNLRGNDLEGSIPSELGALASLDTLELFSAGLSGTIPPSLGNLGSLRRLTVGWNELTGTIPAELGRLANATYMNFSLNQLTGTIPPEFGNLESIESLSVSRNNLTGSIPAELGELATLERLYLYRNQLSGEIPGALGQLSRLTLLWIHENNLTGPIPDAFANLTALEQLVAHENGLSGGIPSFVGDFPLVYLYLHDNDLSGGIPAEIGRISTLNRLTLASNLALAGLLPRSLLDVEHLDRLTFADTGLCPQVDDEFQEWLQRVLERTGDACDPVRLERLALEAVHEMTDGSSWQNRAAWGGYTPVGEWHGITTEDGRVVELSLPDNGLAGPLPAEIANLGQLRVMDLSGNDLSGAFPGALSGLSELTELSVGRNEGLEGALPFGLRRLARLRVLDYDDTGLCASPSANFQAWLTSIPETAGAVCDNPDQVTVSLPIVYLTQSVQTPMRTVRLVANRDAMLRAFVTAEEPRGFFEPEVVAVFTGPGGDEVHRVAMTRDDNRIPAEADEGDLKLSYNAVIPGEVLTPGVRMSVAVDPEGDLPLAAESRTRFPEEGRDSLWVMEVPPMQLTVVPVMAAETTDTSFLAWARGIDVDSPQVGLLKYAFPFAEFDVRAHDVYVTSLDLKPSSGQISLLGELDALRASEGGTGYYYGVADMTGASAGGRGRVSGWVSMGRASAGTLAHEVGHNLSLRHAPCGGPEGVDPAFPYRDGGIGVWGYDFRDGSAMSPERSKDIMSYCRTSPWLSDYHFRRAMNYRRRVEGDRAQAQSAARRPPARVLVIWGSVLDGEMRLEPVFSMRATPRLPEDPGPYRVQGSGPDGPTLFSLDFTPGEDGYGARLFFFTVPIEPGWAGSLERITLMGPEGLVTVDGDDGRAITVVTERTSGRLRAILRDWEGPLPAALASAPDVAVTTTRGPAEAVRLRR